MHPSPTPESEKTHEADLLHFSTDVWSSTVVLFGLGLVYLAKRLQMPWLRKPRPEPADRRPVG